MKDQRMVLTVMLRMLLGDLPRGGLEKDGTMTSPTGADAHCDMLYCPCGDL